MAPASYLTCLLVVIVALAPASARAGEPARVLVLGGQPGSARLQALVSELRIVDLEPVQGPPLVDRASLADPRPLLKSHRARAVVLLGGPLQSVEVFVQGGALRLRREILPRRSGEPWEITTVRLVELLRAHLLELPLSPPDRATPESDGDQPGGEAQRFGLRLAAGPTFSPGGMPVMGHLWLTPSVRVLRWLDAELSLVFPLAPATVEGAEGTADVHLGFATAGLRAVLARQGWWTQPSLSVGIGVSLMHMRGDAVAPYTSEEDWLPSFAGTVGLGLRVLLPWRLSLRLDMLVGLALPRPAVGFGSRTAASWGQPFVALNLGLGRRSI